MKHIIYKKTDPSLLVMSVDTKYNPQLTTNENLAMEFDTETQALAFIDLLNPSGTEFWGSRPHRPH